MAVGDRRTQDFCPDVIPENFARHSRDVDIESTPIPQYNPPNPVATIAAGKHPDRSAGFHQFQSRSGSGQARNDLIRECEDIMLTTEGRNAMIGNSSCGRDLRSLAPSAREIAFVDPGVDDLATLLACMRPDVHAILLSNREPAPRQMARVLTGRSDLDAVHVIAHGRPGEVAFAAGTLSLETLSSHAGELAGIGEALADDGELLLWSCETGQGLRGSAFVSALGSAAGVAVSATGELIGAAAKGGCWALDGAGARAPLTAIGKESYAGVLAVTSLSLTGAGNGQLNASEIAGGYSFSYELNNTGSFGSDVLILIKDGFGNLLYWYTDTSNSSATIPAGALGSYQGPIQVQVFQGTALTDGNNSGNYTGSFKSYPLASRFTFHDGSLGGGNTAVNSGTAADRTTGLLTLDTIAPTVSIEAITSATGIQNNALSAGDTVFITVTMSEAVTVSGTPRLALAIGGSNVQANYASGSGTNQLVFSYTIQAGQTDTNGIRIPANALSLNGGTIRDVAGNNATITKAAVADNANFKVDTNSPDINSAVISGATGIQNNTLNLGDVVFVTVTMNEVVTVTGAPQLRLNIGGTQVQANFVSGSGSNQLVFSYAIQSGQTDTNGIRIPQDALTLNGGTIKDAAGNNADLDLDSVQSNASFKVDTSAPTVTVNILDTSLNNTDNNSRVNFTFSEPPAGFALGDITATNGTVTSLVQDTATTWHATFTAANGFTGQGSVTINAGLFTDAAGNANLAAVPDTVAIATGGGDVTPPTVVSVTMGDSALKIGDTSTVTIVFSEAVTGFSNSDVSAPNGTLSDFTTSDNVTWMATFTPTADIEDAANAVTVAASYTDLAGNAGGTGSSANYAIDTLAPAASITLNPITVDNIVNIGGSRRRRSGDRHGGRRCPGRRHGDRDGQRRRLHRHGVRRRVQHQRSGQRPAGRRRPDGGRQRDHDGRCGQQHDGERHPALHAGSGCACGEHHAQSDHGGQYRQHRRKPAAT